MLVHLQHLGTSLLLSIASAYHSITIPRLLCLTTTQTLTDPYLLTSALGHHSSRIITPCMTQLITSCFQNPWQVYPQVTQGVTPTQQE